MGRVRTLKEHHASVFWHQHARFCIILLVLAGISAILVVPRTQDPSLVSAVHRTDDSLQVVANIHQVYSQGFLRPVGRHCVLYLGHREGQWHWSDCPPAGDTHR